MVEVFAAVVEYARAIPGPVLGVNSNTYRGFLEGRNETVATDGSLEMFDFVVSSVNLAFLVFGYIGVLGC